MPTRRRILPAPALAALALLALAGCGGGARTSAHVAVRTVTRTVTVPAATTTATTGATTNAAPPPPNPNATLSLHAAEQVLTGRGYATLTESDWRPDQPLKVLLGVATRGPAGTRRELAFFFVGATFIGTDTKDPSGQLAVVAQDGRGVTIRYGLYRPSDGIENPTGGGADVTYRWTGSRLVPEQPIPSAAQDAPLSRR